MSWNLTGLGFKTTPADTGRPGYHPEVMLKLYLFKEAFVAIDGSKFKAMNNRDRNFTKAKVKRRLHQIDQSIARYLSAMESLDRQESALADDKSQRLSGKIEVLKGEIAKLKKHEAAMLAAPDQQLSFPKTTSFTAATTMSMNVRPVSDWFGIRPRLRTV